MIKSLIVESFARIGHTWKVDGKHVEPIEADVEVVLDKAVLYLYDEPIGARFETGGLVIEKREHDFDVYVYVGTYN